MMHTNRTRFICGILIVLILFMSACGNTDKIPQEQSESSSGSFSEETQAGREIVLTSNLAAELRKKYAHTEPYEYTRPVENIAQDQNLIIQLGFDPDKAGLAEKDEYGDISYDDLVSVYIDKDFTLKTEYTFEYNPSSMQISVKPDKTCRDPHVYLDEKDYFEYDDLDKWGYAYQYYAVLYYDAETGERLDKPLVTMFTVKAELEAPQLEFVRTNDSIANFSWTPVKGAKEYWVTLSRNDDNNAGTQIITTSDTKGSYANDLIWDDEITLMNVFFHKGSEDDWEYGSNIHVYAVGENGEFSPASNPVAVESFRSYLPYSIGGYTGVADTTDELEAYVPVTMCDDSTVMFTVTYDIDNAEILDVTERYELDKKTILLCIPGLVDGTILKAPYYVRKYNEDTLKEELQALKERIEQAKLNGGGIISTPNIEIQTPDKADGAPATERRNNEIENSSGLPPIFASSALSEYLATNMLSNVSDIDLVDFYETFDADILLDAFYEAYYQNPLILGINNLQFVPSTFILRVTYEQDQEELIRKQKEIAAEVPRVIAEIIKPGMTDIEKEIAINNYLCDTTRYDMDALESAMENDMVPDISFRDSFTPYGILINKVGVCASYASAFKLLAEQAGLESIVATGYLNGSLPHAWNRVKIDGEWLTIDVTNNANPGFYNVFFNLPDDAAAPILLEDDRYVLNSRIGEFTGESGDKEYYRISGKYFEKDQIARKLVDGFIADGRVSLRTDYDLTDSELAEIIQSVALELIDTKHSDALMEAVYINRWGVIYIGDKDGLAA